MKNVLSGDKLILEIFVCFHFHIDLSMDAAFFNNVWLKHLRIYLQMGWSFICKYILVLKKYYCIYSWISLSTDMPIWDFVCVLASKILCLSTGIQWLLSKNECLTYSASLISISEANLQRPVQRLGWVDLIYTCILWKAAAFMLGQKLAMTFESQTLLY